MNRAPSGRYETLSAAGSEQARAFVPHPLPPAPPLDRSQALQDKLAGAHRAIGGLNAISVLLPNTQLFTYMYVRKEAVLSSQIEGTQSTLNDLLSSEAEDQFGAPQDPDITETSCYVKALERGTQLVGEGTPLTRRLFEALHKLLLSQGRGSEKTPGAYRKSQNWVHGQRPGNAEYVPPPADLVLDCMGDLERFIHDPRATTEPLIKAALAHAQFESIHPFLDGNGRLGRMLVTLILLREGILQQPILYISLYLKEHRAEYYRLLQGTRHDGDWESWVSFFLDAIRSTSERAVDTASALNGLFERDRNTVRNNGKRQGACLQVLEAMQIHPFRSIKSIAQFARVTHPTVTGALNVLQELGIVAEYTGRSRGRGFVYEQYLKVLNQGTEPLGPA